jgi:hypothetical protein
MKLVSVFDIFVNRFNFRRPLPPATEYLHQNRKCDSIEGCLMKKAAYVYEELYCVCLGLRDFFSFFMNIFLKGKLKLKKYHIYLMMLDWHSSVCFTTDFIKDLFF